jgi:SAM-dependent methyltransferase
VKDDLYERTRQSWEDIWKQKSSIADELDVLKQPRTRDQFNLFPLYLSRDGYILEAGSGLGATMVVLREQGFKLIGLDYAEQALQQSRAHDPTLPLQVGDVHALPYADNSLFGYLSFGVFEHFAHGMLPALREAYRVLVPGGTLVLTIPYPNLVHLGVRTRRKLMRQSVLTDDDFYESTYRRVDLERALETVGFEVVLAKPTSHSFTFWGLGGPFRAAGYYRTSALAELMGRITKAILPWAFNYTTMIIGRKP